MTDIEIRIAIAEACGWEKAHNGIWWRYRHPQKGLITNPEHLPDYFNDLNAMHEAEKGLTEKQRIEFLMQLSQPCKGAMPLDPNYAEEQWLLVHATARQRTEAFLRTVGKWKE